MKRAADLVVESWRISRASRGGSIAVALVIGATCLLVLVTAGRAAAAEAAVVSSIDEAGSRLVTVTTTDMGSAPDQEYVQRSAALSVVAWAVAVGPVTDVRNVAVSGGTTVARRALIGAVPEELSLVSGRWPGPGEAVVSAHSARELGLATAAGELASTQDGRGWAVVGVFRAEGALADLGRSVLTGADTADPVARLYVVADHAESVDAVAQILRGIAGVDDSTTLAIETSSQLVVLRSVISGELGAASRQLAWGAMGAGLLFVAVILYTTVGARRRDFGRRRALGASRSALMVLVVAQSFWPASAGALIGVGAGVGVVEVQTGAGPAGVFVAAVAVLSLAVAVVAALPAAISAAWRDPVRILRVP